MKVILTIRQGETRRIEAQGRDYAAARESAEAQIPAGWEIIAYRTDA